MTTRARQLIVVSSYHEIPLPAISFLFLFSDFFIFFCSVFLGLDDNETYNK